MNSKLQYLKNRLIEEQAKRKVYLEQLTDYQSNKIGQEQRYDFAQKARMIISEVAKTTQQHIEIQISTLVSSCLAAIFPNPYEFQLRFVQIRNKTECNLVFIKNGNETNDLLYTGGGGVSDIASFALRVSIWCIQKTRPTIILDEPFRFVSVDLQKKCSALLKELSIKLGLQIIMSSHLPELIEGADKLFLCEYEKGISQVKEIQ